MCSNQAEEIHGKPTLAPRLALLGVGYIGGSAALAAKRAGIVRDVIGYDIDPTVGTLAIEMGVLDGFAKSAAEAIHGASLVLLAAPVCRLDALVAEIAKVLPDGCLVMDVGSVKREFVETTSRQLPSGASIGCHPMAGAEFSGVLAADASIFSGRVCYVCPPSDAHGSSVQRAADFWRGIGCRVETIEPGLHDRLMALQSHLPHVSAFALAAALMEDAAFIEETGAPATTSLRDTSRIAASSPTVWRDILLANASELLPLVHRLGETLATIERAMMNKDGALLESVLSRGQAARRRLVKG